MSEQGTALVAAAIARLADIDPPPPPDPVLPTAIAGLLLLVMTGIAIAWRRRHETRPSDTRPSPVRALEALERDASTGRIAGRQIAYEFAALLRYRYGIPFLGRDLPPTCPLAADEWRRLVEWLDRARYAPRPLPMGSEGFHLMRRCLADVADDA